MTKLKTLIFERKSLCKNKNFSKISDSLKIIDKQIDDCLNYDTNGK